jgi:hypothetical protein
MFTAAELVAGKSSTSAVCQSLGRVHSENGRNKRRKKDGQREQKNEKGKLQKEIKKCTPSHNFDEMDKSDLRLFQMVPDMSELSEVN